MFSLFKNLGSASSTVLLILTQVIPLLSELKADAGQPLSATVKSEIVDLAVAALSDFGGASGAALAGDTAVKAIIADAVDLIANLHTKLSAPAAAPAHPA